MPSRGCSGRNELGSYSGSKNIYQCAYECLKRSTCVSFETDGWDENDYSKMLTMCQLSSTCTLSRIQATAGNVNKLGTNEWIVHVRDSSAPGTSYLSGFTPGLLRAGGCSGRNELGTLNGKSPNECAAACTAATGCVNIEYSPNTAAVHADADLVPSGAQCHRSTTCDRARLRSEGSWMSSFFSLVPLLTSCSDYTCSRGDTANYF